MVQLMWREVDDSRWIQGGCLTLWGARRTLRKMGFAREESCTTLDRALIEGPYYARQLNIHNEPYVFASADIRVGIADGAYVISIWMLDRDGSVMTKTQLEHQERLAEKWGPPRGAGTPPAGRSRDRAAIVPFRA
jgi:hypothetical protein